MTTSISQVQKDQISGLISSLDGGKLSQSEVEIFNRFVLVSISLWVGEIDGRLVCLWGLIPPTLLSDRAYLWLHTTEAVKDHEFILVRRSQIEIAKMLEEYPRIVGQCLVGEARSIRWLRWLGAEFGEPEGHFVPFLIERKG